LGYGLAAHFSSEGSYVKPAMGQGKKAWMGPESNYRDILMIVIIHQALDVHVTNGRANQPALIYDSPVTETYKKYT
jgi:hypothetical protein